MPVELNDTIVAKTETGLALKIAAARTVSRAADLQTDATCRNIMALRRAHKKSKSELGFVDWATNQVKEVEGLLTTIAKMDRSVSFSHSEMASIFGVNAKQVPNNMHALCEVFAGDGAKPADVAKNMKREIENFISE